MSSKPIITPHAEASTDSVSQQGFALLEAAMFTARGDEIEWHNLTHASHLWASHSDDLPQNTSGLFARLSENDSAARKNALRALTWNGAAYKVSYQIQRYDGHKVWVEERGQRVSGDGKRADQITGLIRNIQTQKVTEQTAAYTARHDPLTGLWNSARMDEALTYIIAASTRYDRVASYMVLQIANLTDINATYGYDAGDRLLAGIAARLKSHIRAPDLLGRISPASFGIGICDCEGEAAKAMAERLKELLSDTPYQSPHGDLYAEFAFGAVQIPSQAGTPQTAIQAAKRSVKVSLSRQGAFTAFSDELPPLKIRRRQSEVSEADILDALNSRRITLAYQPIVHADTRRPHHYECLLRLRREDGEIVPAGEFIMAAERLGLVHLLDRRALEIASETLRRVPDILLALNISAETAKNDEAAEDYINALKALGPDTQRVSIELTETVAIEDPAKASRFSVQARSLGCRFAIDDFGAGYTTFQNLMAIEADEIKIDGSFIRDLAVTPHKQVFVRMMVDLAQTFSVKTVAEFVNSRDDADLLTRLGVDYLQGYMFGVPSTSPDWPGQSTGGQMDAAE